MDLLAATARRPAGLGELVGVDVPASLGRPRASRRSASPDGSCRRPQRCGRHPSANHRLARPPRVARIGRLRSAGRVRRSRARRPSGGRRLARSEPIRGEQRVPDVATCGVLGGQPVLLRLRRGDRLAGLRPARPSAQTLGAEGRDHRQCDLGRLASAVVRYHRHLPRHACRRLHRVLLQHAHRFIPADLAVPARPRKHIGRGGLSCCVRHCDHHAHDDQAHPHPHGGADHPRRPRGDPKSRQDPSHRARGVGATFRARRAATAAG